MYGFTLMCEITKEYIKISHKISTDAPQNMHFTDFLCVCVICDIFELWRHVSLSEAVPSAPSDQIWSSVGLRSFHQERCYIYLLPYSLLVLESRGTILKGQRDR